MRGELIDSFEVDLRGVVLSYINGLHASQRAKGLGVWIGGRLVPLLFYPDDIVLLADNQAALTASLKVLEDYARQWRFQVNRGVVSW